MQKFARVAFLLLLIVVSIAIVLSQAQLYQKGHTASVLPKLDTLVGAVTSTPAAAVAEPAVASPEDTKRELVEREKDREILRGIQKETARLANSSLAQNYLLLFQAIIYFLTLLILYGLMESVKKIAEAALKSAETARISAESAKAGGGAGSNCTRRDVNKFIMRRLRGNYLKR
jgi:hypothetical protein